MIKDDSCIENIISPEVTSIISVFLATIKVIKVD